jgi:hypothetical protein
MRQQVKRGVRVAEPRNYETDPDETLAILKGIAPETVILCVRRVYLTSEEEERHVESGKQEGYSLVLLSEPEWARVTANGKAPDTANSVRMTVRKLIKLLSGAL